MVCFLIEYNVLFGDVFRILSILELLLFVKLLKIIRVIGVIKRCVIMFRYFMLMELLFGLYFDFEVFKNKFSY